MNIQTRFTNIANTKKKTNATYHRSKPATHNTEPANHIAASTAPDHAVSQSIRMSQITATYLIHLQDI
ncbi:hypothetical protein E2C01_053822 [Portunus trituberculatus]|uniref:Uncharacterized protein n=1 Tax=Portunus trituberculatus TaxID=210409 RepID=A0A5B7GTA9_PORTR|nr:hypothetical protein [Portunus trituberculatus]